MLFMKKMIIILVCLCAMIKYNQAAQPTTVFNCTFNNNFRGNCGLDPVESSTTREDLVFDEGEKVDTSISITRPVRPLSDVTSVFSLTNNGKKCKFSDAISGSDIQFCQKSDENSNYMCETSSGENEVCAKGFYVYLNASSDQELRKSFDTRGVKHSVTTEPQCLTFYSYFTNNNSDAYIQVDWQSNPTLPGQNATIATVSYQAQNGWYKSQTLFDVSATNYTVRFEFYHASTSTDPDPFFIAIDDISITTGACPSPDDGISTTGIIPTTEVTTNPAANTSDISTASTITNPPPTPPKNFGYIHGLSLGISVLTILTYFTTIG